MRKKPNNNANILISDQSLGVPWKGIIEYEILGYTSGEDLQDMKDARTLKKAGTVMLNLYTELLIKDPLWHFIPEGSFNVIRVSTEFQKPLKKLFKKYKLRVHYKGVWGIDSQESTAEYQKVFTYIFHGFAVLAMEAGSHNVQSLLDRVAHIFVLSNMYNYADVIEHVGPNWEAIICANYTTARAFYSGQYYASQEFKNQHTEKKESSNAITGQSCTRT